VQQMQRRDCSTELDRTGDGRAEQLGIAPQLDPTEASQLLGERVVPAVRPLARDRLLERLPAGENTADRLREELELGCYREPHATPSSANTASVSAPSVGATAPVADSFSSWKSRPSIVTAPRPGCSTSARKPFARTCGSA